MVYWLIVWLTPLSLSRTSRVVDVVEAVIPLVVVAVVQSGMGSKKIDCKYRWRPAVAIDVVVANLRTIPTASHTEKYGIIAEIWNKIVWWMLAMIIGRAWSKRTARGT